jgi:hypothetical protein
MKMIGDMRRCRVYQTLRVMNLNVEADDFGVIHVDDDEWRVLLPETDMDQIVIDFNSDLEPRYVADIVARFTCFLQIAGFLVSVMRGQHEDEHSEPAGTIH